MEEDDIEVTDEEEDLLFDGTVFDVLLSGSQCMGVFERLPSTIGDPTLSVRSQHLKRKPTTHLPRALRGVKRSRSSQASEPAPR